MSLQVWLPLNGTTENKGLANVGITSKGIAYQNGKIGKAASFSNGYIGIDGTPITGELSECSICFWVKFDRVDIIMAIYNGRDAIGGPVSIFLVDGHFRFDGGTMHDFPFQPAANTWYHICFTRNAETITMYVNGAPSSTVKAVAGTVVTTKATIGQSNVNSTVGNGANQLFGLLNDYRIYNHCLSPKEVREISKGMCLHYRLSGHGGENLARGTSAEYSTPYTSFNGGINKCPPVANVYTNGLTIGDRVTVSIVYKYTGITAAEGKTPYFWLQGAGNVTSWNPGNFVTSGKKYFSGTDGEIKIVYSFTFSGDHAKNDLWRVNIRHDYIQSGSIQFKEFKVEKGSVATPWAPAPSDTLYSTLGYNDGIEPDCSGLGYDGVKSGEFACNSDTPRYTTSYQIADKKVITAQVGAAPTPTDAITLAVWVKISDYPTSEEDVICNFDGGGCGIFVNGSNVYFEIYSGGWKKVSAPIAKDAWQHVVGTYDGQTLKIYINGALKNTVNQTGQITYSSVTPWCVGGNPNYGSAEITYVYYFTGKVSDARIYATSLSPADVLELYQASASVDNGGNMHAYELVEADM